MGVVVFVDVTKRTNNFAAMIVCGRYGWGDVVVVDISGASHNCGLFDGCRIVVMIYTHKGMLQSFYSY